MSCGVSSYSLLNVFGSIIITYLSPLCCLLYIIFDADRSADSVIECQVSHRLLGLTATCLCV